MMSRWSPVFALVFVVSSGVGLVAKAPLPEKGSGDPKVDGLKPESVQLWGTSDAIVMAKLTKVQAGPVGNSEPPVYTHRLSFQVQKSLRGTLSRGDEILGFHSIRQANPPTFPDGKECVVGLSFARNQWTVLVVREAKAEEVAQAELVGLLPLGWRVEKDKLLSPWASLGKDFWPENARGKGIVCATTGRPSLLVGGGIEFTVSVVPPAKNVEFANPDGDGEYKISVKNATDKALVVPALLSLGDKILWNESLVVLCQNKVYTIPGCSKITSEPKATSLKPGETVSTVVNAFQLEGPEWPRGGYRIEFQFCLGERSSTQSFYYLSRHHDPIREKVLKEKKEK